MKLFSGLAWGAGGQCAPARVIYLALVLGAAVFAAGCGKSKAPATSTPPASIPSAQQADTNQAEAGQAPVNTPVAPPEMPAPPNVTTNVTPTGEPDLNALHQCMIRFLMSHHRTPANFDEFAAYASSVNVAIPPAPPGKKYAIDPHNMHIILVKQ